MKIYIFRLDSKGTINVDWNTTDLFKPEPAPVRQVIEAPFCTLPVMQSLALAILLDWFGDEEMAERKAVALSAGLSVKLTKIAARRQVTFTNGKRGWDLTEEELAGLVTDIMVNAGEMAAAEHPTGRQVGIIEYVTGQRRDTVRHEALTETTPRRLMN